MSGFRVQCSWCGYLTYESDEPCPKCGTLLSLGHVIGDADSGATMYAGNDDGWDGFGTNQTEAIGSTTSPEPFSNPFPEPPSGPPHVDVPAADSSLPEIGFSGAWDDFVVPDDEPAPAPPAKPAAPPAFVPAPPPPTPAPPPVFQAPPPPAAAPDLPSVAPHEEFELPAIGSQSWAAEPQSSGFDQWATDAPAADAALWDVEAPPPREEIWDVKAPPAYNDSDWSNQGFEPDYPPPAPEVAPTAENRPWSAPPAAHMEPLQHPTARPPVSPRTPFGPPLAKAAPPPKRASTGLWIGIAVVAVAAIGFGILLAAVMSTSDGKPSADDARRKYGAALANQPNFDATVEGYESGVPVKMRYASLDGARLVEVPLPRSMFLDTSASGSTQVTVIFDRNQKVTAVAHEFWTYRTVPAQSLGALASAADPFGEIGRISKEKTTTITEAGTEKVGEYDTVVLLISDSEGATPIQANLAPALNNLIVQLDVPAGAAKSKVSLRYTLSKVSMTVDPEIFRVPSSYKELKAQ